VSLHQSLSSRLRTIERQMAEADDHDEDDDNLAPAVRDAMLKAGKAWAKANGIKARELENWPEDEPIPSGMAAAMISAGLEASGVDLGPSETVNAKATTASACPTVDPVPAILRTHAGNGSNPRS
jgi:hypothetical protein